MITRGDLYWVDLGETSGRTAARRRPVLVAQADAFNASGLATTLGVVVTSNTALAAMPGNVFLPATASGLPRDSVVNVTALITLGKDDLDELVSRVPEYLMRDVDQGLRQVLDL